MIIRFFIEEYYFHDLFDDLFNPSLKAQDLGLS